MNKEEFEKSGAWGLTLSIDAKECEPLLIRSENYIESYVHRLCNLIEMKPYGKCHVIYFGEDEKVAGYSLIQLIETSLISGHFSDKTNHAYLDIFSCKWFDEEKATQFTQEFFCAKEVETSLLVRG